MIRVVGLAGSPILFSRVDGRGEIEKEPQALQQAYDLGFRVVAEAWGDEQPGDCPQE